MKPANLLTTASALLWGGAAWAQQEQGVDFGARFSAVSVSTWVWAFAILLGGVLFRMALDIRTHKFSWDAGYLIPTAAVCMGCGFFAIGATEWYIGEGNNLNPFVQMAVIVIASINFEVVLKAGKRWLTRILGEDKVERA